MYNTEKTTEVVSKIIRENGAEILMNPDQFLHMMMNEAPFLVKENSIFTMALTNELYTYFLNIPEEKRKESIERFRKNFSEMLSKSSVELIVKVMCRALGWANLSGSPRSIAVRAGNCYLGSNGIAKDYNNAFRLAAKAATGGDSLGQSILGSCYFNGHGTAKDYAKAVYWYTKAAEQGNPSAQYSLGLCYQGGLGTQKNLFEALRWYMKAYEQGFKEAEAAIRKLIKLTK